MTELMGTKEELKAYSKFTNSFNRLFTCYPTVEELSNALVINHQRSKREREIIEHAYQNISVIPNHPNWVSDININIRKRIESLVISKIGNAKSDHSNIRILPSEEPNELLISNDWRAHILVNGLAADFKLMINFPNLVSNNKAIRYYLGEKPVGIAVPICWEGDFCKLTTQNASLTAKLLLIHDSGKDYILYDGTIIEAQRCYEILTKEYESLPWLQRLFKQKLPSYKEWITHQNKRVQSINDDYIHNRFAKDKALQEEALQQLAPLIKQAHKEFNYVWHDVLNYEPLIFGKTHLSF